MLFLQGCRCVLTWASLILLLLDPIRFPRLHVSYPREYCSTCLFHHFTVVWWRWGKDRRRLVLFSVFCHECKCLSAIQDFLGEENKNIVEYVSSHREWERACIPVKFILYLESSLEASCISVNVKAEYLFKMHLCIVSVNCIYDRHDKIVHFVFSYRVIAYLVDLFTN